MSDERLAGIMELPGNEFLKDLKNFSLFVIEPRTEKYLNDATQLEMRKGKNVSFNLLIDMLRDPSGREKFNKLYNSEISYVAVYFITDEGKYKGEYRFDKRGLIKLLEQAIFDLPEDIYNIFQEFIGKISYDNFRKEHKEDIYDIKIDNIEYKIPVKNIIELLDMPELDFLHILNEDTIYGMPLAHFLYATKEYMKDNSILENYLAAPDIEARLKMISESKYIDIEAINQILTRNDYNFDNIHVNEELKQKILEGIPEELTPLEKAVYIYIKMCKILTYDEEFYAYNQRGPIVSIHENANHVSEITPTNNKVVCYEFNAIYEKMLAELGLNFDTNQTLINGFGGGHANLLFRSDKFLIEADSVTSILQGDIFQAKLNQPLRGLKCKNNNPKTREEFQDTFLKIYFLVASKEEKLTKNKVGEVESFEDILEQYTDLTDNLKPIPVEEKMAILVDKVNSTRMIGIDAYSYVLQLRKIIFTEQEQKDNFRVTVIRNTEKQGEDTLTTAKAVFALRVPVDDRFAVEYYIYSPGEQLRPITKEELQEKFELNEIGYVAKDDPVIPGLGGKK